MLHAAFHTVITTDRHLLEIMRRAERMARANAPLLLHGETGSGKELFAHAIHACSNVAAGPFVAVNCGTLSKELAISELLGYEAGAFTGASNKGRRGKFEQADGGTLQFYSNVAETVSFAQFTLHDLMVTPVVVGLPQTFVNLTLRFAVDGQLKILFRAAVFSTRRPSTHRAAISPTMCERQRRRCAWFDRAVPRSDALLQARA